MNHWLEMRRAIVKICLGCFSVLLLDSCYPTSQPQPSASAPPTSPTPTPQDFPNPLTTAQATPSPTPSPTSEAVHSLETKLQAAVAEAIQTPIASLNCPAQPELNAGDHISCEAVAAGQTFAIAVTMTDTAGQFTWQTRGLLVLSKLEDFIQTRLRERGVAVQADCGGALRVAQPKETFKCQVSDATGQIREVSVIVKDEQGNVDISLL